MLYIVYNYIIKLKIYSYIHMVPIIITPLYVRLYELNSNCYNYILFATIYILCNMCFLYICFNNDVLLSNLHKKSDKYVKYNILYLTYCIVLGLSYIYIYVYVINKSEECVDMLWFIPSRLKSINYAIMITTSSKLIYNIDSDKFSILILFREIVPHKYNISDIIFNFSPTVSLIIGLYLYKYIVYDILIEFPPATLIMYLIIIIIIVDKIYIYALTDFKILCLYMPYIDICIYVTLLKILMFSALVIMRYLIS